MGTALRMHAENSQRKKQFDAADLAVLQEVARLIVVDCNTKGVDTTTGLIEVVMKQLSSSAKDHAWLASSATRRRH